MNCSRVLLSKASRLRISAMGLAALVLCFAARSTTIDTVFYSSSVVNKTIEYLVLKPANYDSVVNAGGRYPVVYLLHCLGGSHLAYLSLGYFDGLEALVDNAGFIVAAPYDGTGRGWWVDSPVNDNSNFSSFLANEFKPRIDSLYATLPDKANTGLAGHSMGGYGALHNLRKYPTLFGSAFSIKGVIDLLRHDGGYMIEAVLGNMSSNLAEWQERNVLSNAEDYVGLNAKIAFYTGLDPADWFEDENRDFDSILTALGVPHLFYVDSTESHTSTTRENVKVMFEFFDSTFTYQPSPVLQRKGEARPHPSSRDWRVAESVEGSASTWNPAGRTLPGPTAGGLYLRALHPGSSIPVLRVQ